ncbi:MAG: MATE family efflux transporter [Acutalibacteraceae bacterium]|nr:MATE family efflux transporter [Acutalibacteraceae bacterium]
MKDRNQKFIEMTNSKPETLIVKMAIPTVISMLVTAFYNMADTYFVSKIENVSATAAVGVVFSLMALIQSVGFFFGQGSGNYISRALGKQNTAEAEAMSSTGFFYSFFAGILITVLGLIFVEPLALVLGSTKTILSYATEYLRYILLGAPFIISSFVINNQLRFQGNAVYAMIGLVSGGIVNIILDPIFIFTLGLETAGAAIATVISQIFSFILLLIGTTKGNNIRIRFSRFSFSFFYLKEISKCGLPSLCRQAIASIASIILNNVAGGYGDFSIAAISIVNRITMFANSAVIGFGQGFQPFCGFNFGAGLYARVKKGFVFCLKVSAVFLLAVSVLGFIFAPQLIHLFRRDPQVLSFGTTVLRFQCISFPFFSVIVMGNMITQNLGMVGRATFLATARQGIFFIPLVIALPLFFGIEGLSLVQMAADLLTAICAIPMAIYVIKFLNNKEKQKENNL